MYPTVSPSRPAPSFPSPTKRGPPVAVTRRQQIVNDTLRFLGNTSAESMQYSGRASIAAATPPRVSGSRGDDYGSPTMRGHVSTSGPPSASKGSRQLFASSPEASARDLGGYSASKHDNGVDDGEKRRRGY